ncbi:MAG TPA: hypothetical protein VE620_14260 [Myxococcales bacterium]|jgi:hypothetical protein|nr:hypothetical protein [Myxococcales bacterium]
MRKLSFLGLALLLLSCSSSKNYAQAVAALVDVSGTYADQKPEVMNVIKKGILPKLLPGDSIFVIRIDSESYKKGNLEAGMTLDVRPSRANAQKLAFAEQLDRFAARKERARFTDIRGAMMLASEYLKETEAGLRTMVLFTDLEEELPKGVRRQLNADEFAGMRILAMNVKKLNNDNANPSVYRARLNSWQQQVKSHGAKEFAVVLEPEKLDELLEH